MYIKQKEKVFIRNVGDICYFQNRAYNTDIMFGGSSIVFSKYLSREPKDETEIINSIQQVFYNTDKNIIKNDVLEFFNVLEDTGMVVRAESVEECNKKDFFDYSVFDPDKVQYENNKKQYTDKQTSIELNEYLKEHPTIMSFQIEIASKCNERCIHCYIPHSEKTDIMSYDIYEKTLKELNEMGTIGLILSGGEPMCHPQFLDFIKLAKKYDFALSILSNLTLMNDEILNELKSLRHLSIQTSLYSMDPEIHDKVTCLEGSFYKTKSAIERLVENNIIVQVSSPAMKANKDSFAEVIDWCENKMKIRAHTDYAIMAESNGCIENLQNRLSLDETKEFINNLIEHDKFYQEMLKSQPKEKEMKRVINPDDTLCGIGYNMAAMNVFGDVIPCSGFESLECGNIMERSLNDIWFNSDNMNLIRRLRRKDYPKCLTCEDSAYCSFCVKRHEGESGDIRKLADHFCKVAHINREVAEEWRKK